MQLSADYLKSWLEGRALIMGRNRFVRDLAPRAALAALAAFLVLGNSGCDDVPVYRRAMRWERETIFQRDEFIPVSVAVGNDGGVYAAGYDPRIPIFHQAVVYRYDGFSATEEFRSPYKYTRFKDIASAAGTLWVTGWALDNTGIWPCLFKRDGGEWTEVAVPSSVYEHEFSAIFPVSCDSCWLVGDNDVYTYNAGEWTKVAPREPRYQLLDLTVCRNGRAFLYAIDYKSNERTVYVSDDHGATWAAERVDLQTEMYSVVGNLYSTAAAGEGWYLTTFLKNEQVGETGASLFIGVVARDDAPPGKGEYGISYIGPLVTVVAPDTWSMVFRNSNTGYLVGYDFSLALENGIWHPEDITDAQHLHFKDITLGHDGYWALVAKEAPGGQLVANYLYRADG